MKTEEKTLIHYFEIIAIYYNTLREIYELHGQRVSTLETTSEACKNQIIVIL